MQLSGIDVNLLVILHPLLQTKNVNEAAKSLGLSPSATSHALARLRDVFDDELLVRAGRNLVLTPRGAGLAPVVAQAISAVEQVLAPAPDFEPSRLAREFQLIYADYLDWTLMPRLDAELRCQAPGVRVHVHHTAGDVSTSLRDGKLDLAVVPAMKLPPDVHIQSFLRSRFVSIVRKGHPCLNTNLDLERFVQLDHILIAPQGTGGGLVDDALGKKGLRRNVVRTFTSFMPAPLLVARSDYILTLPMSVAHAALTYSDFEIVETPLKLPEVHLKLAWHRRMHEDPAHLWFRNLVLSQGKLLQSS